jgi:titin
VERTTTLIVQAEPVPQPPPATPADLTITAVHGDGFDITWTDTSSDEQGFRLYNADTQQVVATFSANVTGGRIVGLACGTPYGFYLVSYNERGESWPSNTERASTSPCSG